MGNSRPLKMIINTDHNVAYCVPCMGSHWDLAQVFKNKTYCKSLESISQLKKWVKEHLVMPRFNESI